MNIENCLTKHDIYFHRLNLITRTWELLYASNDNIRDDDPKGRYRQEIAQDDEYIYIFGGGTQDTSFDMDVVNILTKLTQTIHLFRYMSRSTTWRLCI